VLRRNGLPAIVGSLLALALIMLAGAPHPASRAAQGQKWLLGVPWAGTVGTEGGWCSVTVVSEFLAITAKHCGSGISQVVLDTAALPTNKSPIGVKEVVQNRDLDVEALVLRDRSGLSVTPLAASVARDWFYVWGYGRDWSNNSTNHLTRADFNLPQQCPSHSFSDGGSLCWQTDAKNSVCTGDSGGPITQNGAIIGMFTAFNWTSTRPGEQVNCSATNLGQGLTVQEMQPWLDQMISYASPFPTW
jgi:hypothetical protein